MEQFDLEEDIKDLEGILDTIGDMFGDLTASIKAGMKARLKLIGSHSVMLKRRQNRLKELLTRYPDLDKIKQIPVGYNLHEFLQNEMPMGTEIDILDKMLSLSIEDFNLDVLDILSSPNQTKTFSKLIKSESYYDGICKQLIKGDYFNIDDDFKENINTGKINFMASYVFGKGFKGIVIDEERRVVFHKTLRFDKVPLPPKSIPVSLFNTSVENFLGHTDNDIKTIIGIYRQTIKNISKYLRHLEHEEKVSIGDTRLITDSILFHIDYISDSFIKLTDLQYNFAFYSLQQLEDFGASGTTRGTF